MKTFLAFLFLFASVQLSNLSCCTGIKLVAKDSALVHGRTVEFGIELDLSIAVVPRNYSFVGTTPQGNGLKYTSKYASVGVFAFDHPALMDGINEKGLAVGTFYFPTFAGYSDITKENQSKALSPVEFSHWIVTQFSTVEEVKAALPDVVIAPTVSQGWGSTPPPFHYIVYDRTGKCLVIEPINGKLITYDNPLGTLTNSPTFGWHMTNLRNFIHLTPFNAAPITLNSVKLAPFGAGSGMVGLPGDFTPPSRFVRAAIFSATATPSENGREAIFQLFHLLNQFDIPVGAAREKKGNMVHTDETQFTCARDPQTLQYYFKSYQDQTIQVVDLNRFDFDAKKIRSLDVAGVGQAKDVSSQLKEFSLR